MATKTERILSYLPGTFRALPGASALRAVAAAFGGELQAGENSLAALMRAHWVDHADRGAEQIDDLGRFAVLWGLAPRDDESVEEFREHLKRYVRNQLRGTVTVAGILRVAAETLGLRLTLDDPGETAEPLDAWWLRRNPILEDVDHRGEVRRRRFVSRAFVAGEAARTLLGFERDAASGAPARAARLTGKADLSTGVDLSARRKIRLAIDNAPSVEIDVAGERPRATTLGEAVARIAAAFPSIAGFATHDGRRLVLTSPTQGAASRIAFDFLRPEEDARELLFGNVPLSADGAAAKPGELIGKVRQGGAIDLSRRSLLKLAIDGNAPIEIDVAGATPASTLLDEVVAKIETVLPGVASITETRLRLASPTAGPESRIEVLPLRTIEVEEFPPGPAEARATLVAGGRLAIENRGAAEAWFDLELRSPRGTWAPGIANLRDGWFLRALAALAPGEAVRFIRNDMGEIAASIVGADGTVRPLPAGQLFVGALGLGPGAAARALLLPRGSSELILLDGSAARFDAAVFDRDRFAGPPLVVEGRFDLVRFAPPQPLRDPAAPAFAPLAASAPIEMIARWTEHKPGTFTVRLPLDLPARFGGRFDDARFGYPGPEKIEGVVLDENDPREIPKVLDPAASASKLVTATRTGRAPIGFEAVNVPFRKPRFLRGGNLSRPSRLFLAEPGVPGVIEIAANRNGAWGDEISVAVRPAGPALWDLEIHYRGARFENARQAVLGRPLPPQAREPLPPGPNGVLAGKAAGIAVRVVRDGAELPPSLPSNL